jgi:hypothetical protein
MDYTKILQNITNTADVVNNPEGWNLATLLQLQTPEVHKCACGISTVRWWLTPLTISKATLLQEKLF